MEKIISAFKLVFKDFLYIFLALVLGFNLLLIYYLIFLETTTLQLLFSTTNSFYAWGSIILTILTSLFFGISAAFLIFRWRQASKTEHSEGEGDESKLSSSRFAGACELKRSSSTTKIFGGKSLTGGLAGAFSMGCPICGSLLLPILGVAGGLSIFPFQGLELKAAALFLFLFSIYESSKAISGKVCEPQEKFVSFKRGNFVFNFNKTTLPSLISFLLPILIIGIVLASPFLPAKYKFNLAKADKALLNSAKGTPGSLNSLSGSSQDIFEKINPAAGYQVNASYGDLGPKLLEAGAIDIEEMKSLYETSGQPLTDEQVKILTQGSDEKIKITQDNSYFVLNFLWALGLTNKNIVLDEGPMTKYGQDQIGSFASTGGWTLGSKDATELYSKYEIIKLTPEQQKTLEEFAYNSYRPCCSNPTAFPDCNHGMAALALGEIMASEGASADEIFEAFKYFNGFWFSQTYLDVAVYFEAKEGKEWSEVPGRIVAGKDYSTPQGWQRVKRWLSSNNLIQEAPSSGGSCGA